MRKLKRNQIDFTPLRVGMAALGLSEPKIETWVIQDGAFYNKEKNRWLTYKQIQAYKDAAAWDGVLVILECLPESNLS